jgi:hypothetical protein
VAGKGLAASHRVWETYKKPEQRQHRNAQTLVGGQMWPHRGNVLRPSSGEPSPTGGHALSPAAGLRTGHRHTRPRDGSDRDDQHSHERHGK